MANFKGMDTDKIRSLAGKLGTEAGKIEEVMRVVQRLVDGDIAAAWKGPDADKFKSEWNSNHKPKLKNAAAALKDAKSKAERNASKQDETSSGY